jgi:glycosyltransferase involved in cell wall biosynthesis
LAAEYEKMAGSSVVIARRQKVVMVITGLDVGGAEMMLLKLLKSLNGRFHSHVISLTGIGEIGRRIQELGIQVEALGMRPSRPNPWAIVQLVRRLRFLNPHIVHTWMYHADLIGGIAAKLARVPAVVWCIRNSNLDARRTKASTRAVVRICAVASRAIPDCIVSCSKVAEDLHVERGYARDKMVIIPNGFDISEFRPDPAARRAIREEIGIAMDAPVVGLIARYDPQKNFPGFLRMASEVRAIVPKVRFLMAGGNVEWRNQELVEMIGANGVEDACYLLGLRGDMPQLMAALDVLVSSSSYGEAFPNVLGEAMACGVLCAATDVGDSAVILGSAGITVASGDMVGLASATASLLTKSPRDRLRLGEQARARVTNNFQIGDVVRSYERVYDNVAGNS